MAENKSLTEELEERLDIFFGEGESSAPAPDQARPDSPLEALKSILLSLEWEITDTDLDKFLAELEDLRSKCRENSVEHLFIKLLDSIGRYIKIRKANAHPNTIKLLNNAFRSFSTVVESDEVSEDEKKALLLNTINEFKEVKAAIAREKKEKAAAPARPAAKTVFPATTAVGPADPADDFEMEPLERVSAPAPSSLEGMTPHEAFALALQEIKQTIEKEFQALRAELRMWRSGQ